MLKRVLSKTEKEIFGADLCVRLDYADVAGLTGTADNSGAPLTLFSAPKGTKVSVVVVKLENEVGFDFSDSSINSLTCIVGDSGDTDRFLTTALQLAEDGTEVEFYNPVLTTSPYTYTADTDVTAIVTVAGGGSPTLAECTSGAVLIYFRLDDLTQLPNR